MESSLPTIVLADPMDAAEQLAQALTECGCVVHRTITIRDTMAAVRTRRPELVITELSFDDGCGIDLVSELQRLGASPRVVIATAFPSIQSAQTAIRLGAADYLTKPVTAREILTVLNQCDSDIAERWLDVREVRRDYIASILPHCGSVAQTARILGLDRRSLRRMLASTRPKARPRSALTAEREQPQ